MYKYAGVIVSTKIFAVLAQTQDLRTSTTVLRPRIRWVNKSLDSKEILLYLCNHTRTHVSIKRGFT